ncbi:MAG: hypothetical protein R8K46_00705 [Mariprofundaceae bacterium]
MQISCPHCSARYEVEGITPEDILECHNCGAEFSVRKRRETSRTPDLPLEQKALFVETELDESLLQKQLSSKISNNQKAKKKQASPHAAATPECPKKTEQEKTVKPENLPPPQRHSVRIWPWLLIVLLAVAGSGVWLNKDAWLDNAWVRGSLANLGLPIPVRDKDWSIIQESVRATWVERDDGSRVMVIEGRLANLLPRPMPLPRLRVRYFSLENPNQPIREFDLGITEPPLLDDIRRTPFKAPPPDNMTVMDLAERDFVLVIEDAPREAGDFELKPIAQQASDQMR